MQGILFNQELWNNLVCNIFVVNNNNFIDMELKIKIIWQ